MRAGVSACALRVRRQFAKQFEEQFDVAIRIHPSRTAAWVGRCFAKDRLVVVAAPGLPIPIPAEARPVPAIVYSDFPPAQWKLNVGRLVQEPGPRIRLSSFRMARNAAAACSGAALIPQCIAWDQLTRGELVQWGVVTGVDVGLRILHTSRRRPAPNVRVFVEFMCERHSQESLALVGSLSSVSKHLGPVVRDMALDSS